VKNGKMRRWRFLAASAVLILGVVGVALGAEVILNLQPFLDPTGIVATYNTAGNIDTSNNFFQSLGTNGRTCETCHQPNNAFGLSAGDAQIRFFLSHGTDPLFAGVDGANCPTVPQGDLAGHSLVLEKGLIRVFLPVPSTAEFGITLVHDPYGCALQTDSTTGQTVVSVYRRPLPTTNLNFLSSVMFDGRETVSPLNSASTFQTNLNADLIHQAMDAINTHAQASPPVALTDSRLPQIVQLELGLFSAQEFSNFAGPTNAGGAQGGPVNLSEQQSYPGINDVLGGDPTGAPFNSTVFTLFAPWQGLTGDRVAQARAMVAAGETIFNTHPLTITNVRGINDNAAVAAAAGTSLPVATFSGTCTTCHDTPNVGNHSVALPLDIGTSHFSAQETDPTLATALAQLQPADVPVYLITGCPDPFAAPGNPPTSFYTSDPGKALISGKCSDFNRGKGPILRGLAARAPYFHNGAAQDLNELVNFYNVRFQMNLSDQEKAELIAFLNSL
jgi:cytochrome c peroxidase